MTALSSAASFLRVPRRDVRYLLFGAIGFAAWMLVFAAGILVNSGPYRTPLANGEFSLAGFLAASLLFTPINAAFLSCLAGFVGGCASKLVAEQDGFDKLLRDGGHTRDLAEFAQVARRLVFMRESPALSMLRGFVVYLTFLAGILVATDDPFTVTSPSIFMRYAGMVSLVAFVIGYDPTRFDGLLAHIPSIGRTEDRPEDGAEDRGGDDTARGSSEVDASSRTGASISATATVELLPSAVKAIE